MKNKIVQKLLVSKRMSSDFLAHRIEDYLADVVGSLHALLDKRLCGTFVTLFTIILQFRNSKMGLLLSELGGYVCGFDHAPAGTKRISNLLRSKNWSAAVLDGFLFEKAKARIHTLSAAGIRPLLLWDESVVEKAESWFLEGLCSVVSSKGKRLCKIKRGFYKPPLSRICVPGFRWTAVLLSALGQVPSVCQMSYWTTRGKYKEEGSNIVFRLLRACAEQIGSGALHVLDRGYASSWTLEWMSYFKQDFLVRWKKNHRLVHAQKGEKQTHLLARSFKAISRKIVSDKERKVSKHISVAYCGVTHPEFSDLPLWLVIVRDRKGHQPPMYLLTSIEVDSKQRAWEMVHSYMHRWGIEQAFRVGKCELGLESPRLWLWENRLKLLAMVSLVYDFLLSLLREWPDWVRLFLEKWCHRTGNRYKKALLPIYRLRLAIANCLLAAFAFQLIQNSG